MQLHEYWGSTQNDETNQEHCNDLEKNKQIRALIIFTHHHGRPQENMILLHSVTS